MNLNFLETMLVLVISGVVMLFGNFVGYKIALAAAIPGMIILFLVIMAGLALWKIIPGSTSVR
ncbi:MAG: hypothetical protein HPY55_09090 [Firmicutes bacterium]|nr:hypothetical protein [Bacillota bacterium]